ncbi:hypothetical protein ES332_D04G185600v1 [Gossypium tomentosum]|uniref:Uncharacterized protein n=1 Tax=Gossypium tomentosum TaxID=34277 RepID=A0A5D2LFC5_GOSTO|nr:hypothetical protein ES332_D04G185600v1 [Gossypium tomentosum]
MSSPWDFTVPNVPTHSNLQCFLQCITPIVKKCNKRSKEEAEKEGFKLSEVWESYSEWSAYGVAVPILLNNGDRVVQYYSPTLSALQLYTSTLIDDKLWGKDKSDKTSSNDNSSCLGSNATKNDDNSCNIQTTADRCGYLYCQYDETTAPYDRVPFTEKIKELGKHYPGLINLHCMNLSPYSWIAIAWYPVYQIPTAINVKELSACFVTYHPLFSLPQASENVKLEVEKVEGKKSKEEEMCLPPFAMVSYKMFGTLWTNPKTTDYDIALRHQTAACCWLKQLNFHHHDFNFFMSRQYQNY